MKRNMFRLLAAALLASTALAQDADIVSTRARPAMPDARGLLDACLAALPDVPLLVTGQLHAKKRTGATDRKLNVEMLLDWQATPPSARYTLRDAFGRAESHLSITWEPGREPEYRYFIGDPLTAAPLPALSEPIEGADISWMDLSLSFLRWPEARTVGVQEVRDRYCYVIDLTAPATGFGNCVGVRVWIDPKIPVMLRAEAFGADNERLRRMDVTSFKKINGRWVIQVMEITSYPSRHRTILRVTNVQDRQRIDYLQRDEGGEDMDNVFTAQSEESTNEHE